MLTYSSSEIRIDMQGQAYPPPADPAKGPAV